MLSKCAAPPPPPVPTPAPTPPSSPPASTLASVAPMAESTGKVGVAGSLLSCDEEATEDFDAGLCYPKCNPGFHGVGAVCA